MTFETHGEMLAWLQEHSPGTVILEGLDAAIVGVFGSRPGLACLVYDRGAIVKVLREDFKMSYADAVVHFSDELFPLWLANGNPCFIDSLGFELNQNLRDGPR